MPFLSNRFSLTKNGFVVAQFCGVLAQMATQTDFCSVGVGNPLRNFATVASSTKR